MFKVYSVPADSEVYEAARLFLAGIQDVVGPTTSFHHTQIHSNAAFLATMQHKGLVLNANEDCIAFAAELCNYAERND